MKNKFYIFLIIALFNQLQINIGQTTIFMQKDGGVYTIPCSVNGLLLRFIFDTGASDVSISMTEARFMLKNGYLKAEDIKGTQYFQSATGEISEGTKIILRKIEFSGLILYDVEASVVHGLSAPLLLGQTAMIKLGKFIFDPKNSTLTIIDAPNNSNSNSSSGKNSSYLEKLKVNSFAPIYDSPDMANGKQIGEAQNNTVLVLRKENDSYYYVQSGKIVGYLHKMWITGY